MTPTYVTRLAVRAMEDGRAVLGHRAIAAVRRFLGAIPDRRRPVIVTSDLRPAHGSVEEPPQDMDQDDEPSPEDRRWWAVVTLKGEWEDETYGIIPDDEPKVDDFDEDYDPRWDHNDPSW